MKYLKIKEDELIDLIENIDKIFSFYDIYPIRQFSDIVSGKKVKNKFKIIDYINFEAEYINHCKKLIKEITSNIEVFSEINEVVGEHKLKEYQITSILKKLLVLVKYIHKYEVYDFEYLDYRTEKKYLTKLVELFIEDGKIVSKIANR